MGIRDEQKNRRRQKILEIGLDLFIRKGYAATQISDIAKEAGMSAGLFFHYFESKEKLYEELILQGLSGPRSAMAFDQSDPLSFFEAVATGLLEYIKANSSVAKMFVFMNQAHISDATPPSAKALLAQIDNLSASIPLIIAGQKSGAIREGDPLALSLAFWMAIQGIAEALAMDSALPVPDGNWIVNILRR